MFFTYIVESSMKVVIFRNQWLWEDPGTQLMQWCLVIRLRLSFA
jgi:hypothetical protein